MEFQNTSKGEHYNLRWNNYTTNLIQVFSEHQHHETLVDVTLTCEGQFVKAHKLILSACSGFFQEMFKMHNGVQHNMFIVLNGIKFNHLTHILDFIYHGEIKILDADLEGVLSLGEYFQVKGLSSVKLKQQVPPQNEPKNTSMKYTSTDPVHSATNSLQDAIGSSHKENIKSPSNNMPKSSSDKSNRGSKRGPNVSNRTELEDLGNSPSRLGFPNSKERIETTRKRLRTPEVPPTSNKEPAESPATGNTVDSEKIPRPANAFMIFANEWRRKLAVEHPEENNKGISVRLGNMWKSLSTETKDSYYLAARKAQKAHEIKYPGYSYNPQEARRKKAARQKTIDSIPQMDSRFESDEDDLQIIEISEDPIDISDIPENKGQFF